MDDQLLAEKKDLHALIATSLTTQSNSIHLQKVKIREENADNPSYDIVIDYQMLYEASSILGTLIKQRAYILLPMLSLAVGAFPEESLEKALSRKPDVNFRWHARIRGLKAQDHFPTAEEVGQLCCLQGTVVQLGEVKLAVLQQTYQCADKHCHALHKQSNLHIESEYNELTTPLKCGVNDCKSHIFNLDSSASKYVNYRRVRLADPRSHLSNTGKSISIDVYGPMATSEILTIGASLQVTGIVTVIKQYLEEGESTDFNLTLHANYIEANNDSASSLSSSSSSIDVNPLADRRAGMVDPEWSDFITAKICTKLYGMRQGKLALALVLAAQKSRQTTRSEKEFFVRQTPHVLFAGDHHVGKTLLLDSAAKLANRAVTITASGTTTAGLTFAKSVGNHYTVEPGALAIASGGICCIDNIDAFSEAILESLKDAMESQRVIGSFGGGLQVEMQTVCSLVAARSGNGQLSTPFESRIDLIFNFLADTSDNFQFDVANHMLRNPSDPNSNGSTSSQITVDDDDEPKALQELFTRIASQEQPTLGENAKKLLNRFFEFVRKQPVDRAVTNRFLESLVRLTLASAKLMMRQTATVYDAIASIRLMRESLIPLAVSMTRFPLNPKDDYEKYKTTLFNLLGVTVSSTTKNTEQTK